MRKTLTINISGIVFYIDDNAYEVLRSYLNKLKTYFGKQEGGEEIIADIESRIAELFQESISSKTQVIHLEDVQRVIEQLGKPEDFIEEDESFSAQSDRQTGKETTDRETERTFRQTNKKLFRDPENRVFAGVCSGLAHYFNIDLLAVRIIMSVLFFATSGTFGFIYLVLWIAVPEAISVGQRLEMMGKAVNISNIQSDVEKNKKKEKEGSSFEEENTKEATTDKIKGQHKESKHQKSYYYNHNPRIKVKPGSASPHSYKKKDKNFADVLLSMIKIFFIFIGSIILVSLILGLFGVVIGIVGITGILPVDAICIDDWHLLPEVFLSYSGAGFLGVVLIIGIPIFLLVYLITKIAFKHQGKTGWVIVISFILWFVGFGLILRTGVGLLHSDRGNLHYSNEKWQHRIESIFGEINEDWDNDWKDNRYVTTETNFTCTSDTLYISMNAFDTIPFKANRGRYMKIENQNLYLGIPKVHLYSSKTDDEIKLIQKSTDKDQASNSVYFPVYLKNDTLHLPRYFSFERFEPKPELNVTLKLPPHKTVFFIEGSGNKNIKSVVWKNSQSTSIKDIPGKYIRSGNLGLTIIEE